MKPNKSAKSAATIKPAAVNKGKNPSAPFTPANTETNIQPKPAKPSRAEIVALCKELNVVADLKIPVTANTATEFITAQIENNVHLLTADDFMEQLKDSGSVTFTDAAKATYIALGHAVPKPGKPAKTAEELTTEKKEKPAKKAAKKTDIRYTRSDSAMASIREMCIKGATLKQIVDRTDAIHVEHGNPSVPDAININKYALNGLVAFNVLTLKDGIYTFTVKA
jgi:hypothetical protein